MGLKSGLSSDAENTQFSNVDTLLSIIAVEFWARSNSSTCFKCLRRVIFSAYFETTFAFPIGVTRLLVGVIKWQVLIPISDSFIDQFPIKLAGNGRYFLDHFDRRFRHIPYSPSSLFFFH